MADPAESHDNASDHDEVPLPPPLSEPSPHAESGSVENQVTSESTSDTAAAPKQDPPQETAAEKTEEDTQESSQETVPEAKVVPNVPMCHRCKEEILDSIIKVGTYQFHTHHFTCTVCDTDLAGGKFYNKDNDFYCQQHYEEKFLNRCQACNNAISSGRQIKALGFHYHADCFRCSECNCLLSGKYFNVHNKPYCQEHAAQVETKKAESNGQETSKCSECGEAVTAVDQVKVLDKLYHKKCLSCHHCKRQLAQLGSKIYRKGEYFYCERDYQIVAAHSCTACGENLLDAQIIFVNGEYYHPDCFKCRTCDKSLDMYFSIGGELRCADHTAASGLEVYCDACGEYIETHLVQPASGRRFHQSCMTCNVCSKQLSKGDLKIKNGEIGCGLCLYEKFTEKKVYKSPALQRLKSGASDGTDSAENSRSSFSKESPKKQLLRQSSNSKSSLNSTMNRTLSTITPNMLNNWKKGQMIGKGQFGKVYTGLLQNGMWIAIKQVELKTEEDEENVKMMEMEVSLMEKLRHENIVCLLGTSREEKYFNILMEYVPGKSMDVLLANFGAFPETTIRWYSYQLLRALAYTHSHGVIHRDIKGKNILVDTNGNCKLADFGSAKQFDSAMMTDAPSVTYNYTPLWTAPEVILNGRYDRKVDIWSLGCVLIEMGTAKLPWSEREFPNPFTALFHIGNSGQIPAIPDTLSEQCQDFIRQMLTRDPDQRPDAEALLEHPFLEELDVPEAEMPDFVEFDDDEDVAATAPPIQ